MSVNNMIKFGSNVVIEGHEFYDGAKGYLVDYSGGIEDHGYEYEKYLRYLVHLKLTGANIWIQAKYVKYLGPEGEK